MPVTSFLYDNWEIIDAPDNILTLLQSPLVAFTNTNNRSTAGAASTPQVGNDIQTLYYTSSSGERTPILNMDASTGRDIFIAPTGDALAYMRYDNNPNVAGLYAVTMSLSSPLSGRVLPITSLIQRGIPMQPSWSPDGTRMAVALASGYDIDIFTVGRDGSSPINLTDTGSYDFYPVWSPDGRSIAFVSDRAQCPSWRPGEPGTCDGGTQPPPTGGYVYLLDIATRNVTQLSEQWVTEPPRWINPRQLTYNSGDPAFGDPERSLWIVDIITRQTQRLTLNGVDDPIKLSEAWSPTGQFVIYQAANATDTVIVLTTIAGTAVVRTTEFSFARYGLSAAWSPDGTSLALGGVNGNCPYGVIVRDTAFDVVGQTNPPPSMCEPEYSPDSRFLAFTGVNPRIDGRIDVYIADRRGYGAINATGTLRGSIDMFGWVGG